MATAAHRWLERLAAAGVGSLLTAWCMRDATEDVSAVAAATTAATVPAIAAVDEGAVAAAAPAVALPGDVPVLVAPVDEADAERSTLNAERSTLNAERSTLNAQRSTLDARRSTLDASPTDTAEPPPTDAPTLSLPRMPGATRLSDASRFDAESGTWILRAAYRVHARDHHVIAFYAKALADAGLEVTDAADPTAADGTSVSYLLGRNDRVRAQVSVRTQPGKLEARIGILWRERP